MKPQSQQALAALGDAAVPRLSGIDLAGRHGSDADEPGPAPAAAVQLTVGAAGPAEPVWDREAADDIQGNVLPGFNKDHQHFLFLTFGEVGAARAWLRWLGPRLASMREVLEFRTEFRAERLLTGSAEPSRAATWLAAAFTRRGLAVLLGDEAVEEFGDQSFRQGLAERSTYLGDPTDPSRPGHRDSWVVGGPETESDALVVVAADSADDLATAVAEVVAEAAANGVAVAFEQRGQNLTGNLAGHEHFGFKDGVSQPGVRGAVETADAPVTPRYLDPSSPHAALFSKPGQPLVWPGQFLLGEQRQDLQHPSDPAVPSSNFPGWAARGSYLVCRRLAQDVPAFWDYMTEHAQEAGTTPVRFASLLVGRWPSGAPVSRVPEADDPGLAGDEFANNHFLFDDDTRPTVFDGDLLASGYAGDAHPPARADVFGRVCPHSSHIRKVNPRDTGTDFGAPADTLLRLMLRRGIPYGEPLAGVPDPSPELVAAERGLMFLAYMSSIEDQFEFVTRRWSNSPVQPNLGGHDPVIGQRDSRGDRTRTVDVPAPDGGSATFRLDRDFVVPTGGGYFFAPPISSVAGVLGAEA